MDKDTKKIPVQLKQFISKQYYDSYSPIDHAVWRFVMKQNHYFLKEIAHPYYVNGLKDSGIKTESIPKVDDMNTSLAKVGWGAVTIDGLIPGSAFYGFLANGILPIATEIRKIENIAYTPAPDMIHEAAGHAPILLDESYRGFVKKIGEMGSKAISSKEKLEVFKAVRHLTIVAEDPHSTEEQVKEAERQVAAARAKVKGLSEADQVFAAVLVDSGIWLNWRAQRSENLRGGFAFIGRREPKLFSGRCPKNSIYRRRVCEDPI